MRQRRNIVDPGKNSFLRPKGLDCDDRRKFRSHALIIIASLLLCTVIALIYLMLSARQWLFGGALGIALRRNDVSPLPSRNDRLRIVSMNIAMAVPSKEAPYSWLSDNKNTPQINALQKELLESDPDILALQECPGSDWARDLFSSFGFEQVGSKRSHAGYVVLLIRKALSWHEMTRYDESSGTNDLPMVAACLVSGSHNQFHLVVASVHLEPFQEGSFIRQHQVDQVIEKRRAAQLL